MKYDKDGLPIKEYYTEELKTSPEKKMQALKYQKYYKKRIRFYFNHGILNEKIVYLKNTYSWTST